jgi:hypothetical protein
MTTLMQRAGFFPAYIAVARAGAVRNAIYIAPAASGLGDGSSWSNAASLASLNDLIAQARGSGAEIWLRADAGVYSDGARTINQGGTAAAPVIIRGVNVDGTPGYATFRGNRSAPYVPPAVPLDFFRTCVFGLATGANYLHFAYLALVNSNNGLIRTINAVSGIVVEDIALTNVRHGINGQSASFNGITIRRLVARGYSKRAIILASSSNAILVEYCDLDSQQQDKDNFAGGVVFDGTAHDALVRHVRAANHYSSLGGYWNADAFSSERGNYNLAFEDCEAAGDTDGGWDLKSRSTTLLRCVSRDNKRNNRLWGEITLTSCQGISPFKRGGSGASYQIGAYDRSFIRVITSTFSQVSSARPFYVEKSGFLAMDAATQAATVRPGGGSLVDINGPDAQFVTLDTSDTSPLVLTSPSSASINEESAGAFAFTANKPFVLEIVGGADADQFAAYGRTLRMKRQDFDTLPSPVLHVSVRGRDANNNRSAVMDFAVTIIDIDDSPISTGELLAYAGSDGSCVEFRRPYLWADLAMTAPAQPGDGVAAITDVSGKGRHWRQPDPYLRATYQTDGFIDWIEDLDSAAYLIGDEGTLRFAQLSAVVALERTALPDGTAENVGRQYLLAFPRSASEASFNAVWALGVIGGNDAWMRLNSTNTTASDNSAPASKPIALAMRSGDAVLQRDGTTYADGPDVASLSYAAAVAAKQAMAFAEPDPVPNGNFSGRAFGAWIWNRSADTSTLFRVQKQLLQLAGEQL